MNPSSETPVDIGQAEDCGSFEVLFRAQYSRLARLIGRVVGDLGQAEDLAAEVLWKFHQKGPKSAGNVAGWLSRTAIRSALDALRGKARRSWYEALWPLPAPASDPEERLERNQERDQVRRTLAALKARDAELLLLRSEGLSYTELALALDLNPASIGTLLARAEASFRKEYVKRYGER